MLTDSYIFIKKKNKPNNNKNFYLQILFTRALTSEKTAVVHYNRKLSVVQNT